eukprot:Gb_26430 [translate_table: standard]
MIFYTELAARPLSVPSTSHTERGPFGIAEDIDSMYQDLDRRYAKARGEIRGLASHSRHHSRSRTTSSHQRESDTIKGDGESGSRQ